MFSWRTLDVARDKTPFCWPNGSCVCVVSVYVSVCVCVCLVAQFEIRCRWPTSAFVPLHLSKCCFLPVLQYGQGSAKEELLANPLPTRRIYINTHTHTPTQTYTYIFYLFKWKRGEGTSSWYFWFDEFAQMFCFIKFLRKCATRVYE